MPNLGLGSTVGWYGVAVTKRPPSTSHIASDLLGLSLHIWRCEVLGTRHKSNLAGHIQLHRPKHTCRKDLMRKWMRGGLLISKPPLV